MKKCLKVKLLILIFLTGIQYVSAQGTAVNGTVVSDQNEPLVGVTVTEAGTTNGVITDMVSFRLSWKMLQEIWPSAM